MLKDVGISDLMLHADKVSTSPMPSKATSNQTLLLARLSFENDCSAPFKRCRKTTGLKVVLARRNPQRIANLSNRLFLVIVKVAVRPADDNADLDHGSGLIRVTLELADGL